jgi:creatinine amidohydrolase
METSMLMALRPDLVDAAGMGPGQAHKPRLAAMREGWAWIARPWHLLTDDSGVGDPSRSTADKGERFLEACTQKLAGFLVELSEMPVDETFPYAGDH